MRSALLLLLVALAVSSTHAQDGTLDATFGAGGIITTDFAAGHDRAYEVRVQPDGKIVVVGYANSGSSVDIALSRYNPDGSLDATFGTGGTVTTDFAGRDDYGYALVSLSDIIVADGRVVVGGYASTMVGSSQPDFALVRYNTDGSLDATFGTGGRVTTDFAGRDDYGYALALQPDGKLILAGDARNASYDFGLARYNPDGSLDATFGTGGKVTTNFTGGYDGVGSLTLLPGGQIVAAGRAASGASGNDFALARYDADGSLDATFGTGGRVTTDFLGGDDRAAEIIAQPDGKLLVVGRAFNGTDNDFALARYNADGTLDATFGTGGKVVVDLGGEDRLSTLVLMPDGRIVAAGTSGGDFAIARFHVNGTLDVTFGMSGVTTTDFAGGADAGNAMDVQADGKLVVAGTARGLSSGDDFAIARYNNNTGLPPLICNDPSQSPSYDGGYVTNTAKDRAFIEVSVPTGGTTFEFYNMSNLVVGMPEADTESGNPIAGVTRLGNTFSFSPASPGTVFFPVSTADPGNTRVRFFLRVTDTCGRTVDVDPEFSLATAGEMTQGFSLSAYPNPFAGQTTLAFSLEEAGAARLSLYDVLGREVAVVAAGDFGAGQQTVRFDAEGLSSGLYIVRFEAAGRVLTKTLTIAR